MQRVEQLADRDVGYTSKDNIRFRSMLPLAEIISAVIGQGVSTKSVLSEYFKLVKNRNEFDVLIDMHSEELSKLTSGKITSAIMKNREGRLKVSPGYDGVYGRLLMDENDKNNNQYIPEKTPIQHNLTEFV